MGSTEYVNAHKDKKGEVSYSSYCRYVHQLHKIINMIKDKMGKCEWRPIHIQRDSVAVLLVNSVLLLVT